METESGKGELSKRILSTLNKEVLDKLDLAKSITHPGESGRAREQIIANFLRKLLPSLFCISTGFVFDALGKISKQIDIVIYRDDYYPVFEIGGIKHFIVESVVAVLENKASIQSVDSLENALENIKSVKELDRTNRGKNYIVDGSQKGLSINPDDFNHQIFGAIVTEESLNSDTLKENLLGFIKSNKRNVWPNFYADVRHCAVYYLESLEPPASTANPNLAQYLGITDKSSTNFKPPLIELAFEIINFLRVSSIIDFKPTDYISSGGGKINYWKI